MPNPEWEARSSVVRWGPRTATLSTARQRPLDFLREQKEPDRAVGEPMMFRSARGLFPRRLGDAPVINPASKKYRLRCLGKLASTQPSGSTRPLA